MSRRLERHLDQDLIDRMDAGWTPTQRPKKPAAKYDPRPEWTYRAYWRNAWRENNARTLLQNRR